MTYIAEARAISYDGDDPQYQATNEDCYQAPIDAGWVVSSPIDGTEDGLRLLYRLWSITYDCLVDGGYPTVPPPTEDAFVESPGNWHPYGALPTPGLLVIAADEPLSEVQQYQLEVQGACPADPISLLVDFEAANDGQRP